MQQCHIYGDFKNYLAGIHKPINMVHPLLKDVQWSDNAFVSKYAGSLVYSHQGVLLNC